MNTAKNVRFENTRKMFNLSRISVPGVIQSVSQPVRKLAAMGRKRSYPNLPFRHMLGGTKKNQLQIPVRTACVPAEIRTAHLSNTSQKRYCLNHK